MDYIKKLDDLIAKKIENEIFKTLTTNSDFTYTTNVNQSFSEQDIKKLKDYIENLPPLATEIRVFRAGYDVIIKNVSTLDDLRKEEFMKYGRLSFDGINVVVIDKDDEMKFNQGKVIYNDGSSKIIDIFKVEYQLI